MNETPSHDVIEEQTDELNAALTDKQVQDALPGRWTHPKSDIDLDVATAREIIHDWMTDPTFNGSVDMIEPVRGTDNGGNYEYNVVSLQQPEDRPVMVMGETYLNNLEFPVADMEALSDVDQTDYEELKALGDMLTAAVEAAGWSDECCPDATNGCPHSWQTPVPLDPDKHSESIEKVKNWTES